MPVRIELGVESETQVHATEFDIDGVPTIYEIYTPGSGGSVKLPVGLYAHPEIVLLSIVRDLMRVRAGGTEVRGHYLKALTLVSVAMDNLTSEANNP